MTPRRDVWLVAAVLAIGAAGATVASGPLFSEDFEGSLAAKWTGKSQSGTSAVIVTDPLRPGNHALSFTRIASGGDLFSQKISVSKAKKYRLTFDYMGKPDTGGGIIGVSLETPGHHRWLAGVSGGKGAGEKNPLVDDGKWHSYKADFSPGDHKWFTHDGSAAVDPGAITSLRIMVETHFGTPGDAYFDNIALTPCTDTCSGAAKRPVRVRIGFHANNLPTAAPNDGGQCPGARQAARITGEINAQITPLGKHEGGGDVDDTPHRSRCRVPSISVRVDRIRLRVIEPGKTLRATISVHIDGEGVHRPGDCRVGTRGTITAIYDDTSRAKNSLRNDSVRIGPWRGCTAHTHEIDNNVSSIAADASRSTWVRVNIACLPRSGGGGYSPRNCD